MSCHGGDPVILSITNDDTINNDDNSGNGGGDDDDGDGNDGDDDVFHLFPIVNAVINSVTADDRSPC